MPAQIGYARVSTAGQNLDVQIEALERAGCDRVFTDHMSGATASRPGLDQALDYLRAGDTLTVWKLDRLGRSMRHMVELANSLAERGINLQSLTDGVDTNGPAGRFVFNLLAALASMERDLVRERTQAGLEAARRQGRRGGRPRRMTPAKLASAKAALAAGQSPAEVATAIGVSRATLYRYL